MSYNTWCTPTTADSTATEFKLQITASLFHLFEGGFDLGRSDHCIP